MSDRLESNLRDALAREASRMPADAGARLRGLDYRPRPPLARAAVAGAGAAGVAGAAAIVLFAVGLGAGTPKAFAGWSATPTVPAQGQTASALGECEAQLQRAAASMEENRQHALEYARSKNLPVPSASQSQISGWQEQVADTRGPYTLITFQASGGVAEGTCLAGASTPAFVTGIAAGITPEPVPANQARIAGTGMNQLPATGGERQPYTYVDGHVGAGVTGVTIILQDGTKVTASIANGSFVAWWPGTANYTADEVITATGTTTNQRNKPPAPTAAETTPEQ